LCNGLKLLNEQHFEASSFEKIKNPITGTTMKKILSSTMIIGCFLALSQQANAQTMPYQHNKQMQQYQAPQPLTEDVLKQRLNFQLNFTKHQMFIDKKLADDYAARFARAQKQQADALAKIMDQADKRRLYALQRLEMQQQLILDQFSKFQISQDTAK